MRLKLVLDIKFYCLLLIFIDIVAYLTQRLDISSVDDSLLFHFFSSIAYIFILFCVVSLLLFMLLL